MAGGCAWSRRTAVRARTLRGLVRHTQSALQDVAHILQFDPEVTATVQDVEILSNRATVVVILGTSASARARLLHCLLGRRLLPDPLPRGCRWLRIQYGSSTQAQLTLGNSEFELVEELECNKRPWDTIPLEDLIRQDTTDLSTILEIELNNSFLKEGLKIIVPPDIDTNPGPTNYDTLKQTYSELYKKRELILKNYNPVYLYAIDKLGKSVFSENFINESMVTSRSEEDFWNSFNLYNVKSGESEGGGREGGGAERVWKEGSEEAVISSENCLNLHQIKEIDANAQLLFVLFADSGTQKDAEDSSRSTEESYRSEELPESDQGLVQNGLLRHQESPEKQSSNRMLYEEQVTFMNELLDQWELMSNPPPRHHVKSQWAVVDDVEILRTADPKALSCLSSIQGQPAVETLGKGCKNDKTMRKRVALVNTVVKFATDTMQSYLLEFCTRLSEVHVKTVQQLVLASFDLARELQLVPRKIHYVATHEQQLYEGIQRKFSEGDKKQELVELMQEVLQEMRAEVANMDWSIDDLPCHQDHRFIISNSVFYSSQSSPEHISLQLTRPNQPINPPINQSTDLDETPSDSEEAVSCDSYNFDDYEIIHSTEESLGVSEYSKFRSQLDDASSMTVQIGAIPVENEGELFSLSSGAARGAWASGTHSGGSAACSTANASVKRASLDVQQAVLSQLSRKISLKLVKFVDCLKDSYFGTLQSIAAIMVTKSLLMTMMAAMLSKYRDINNKCLTRCLESLESSCRQELGGRPASEAMRQLLFVARQVDLRPCASFSLLRSLLESVRRLFSRLHLVSDDGAAACCVLSPVWRRHAALQTAQSLSPQRLARLISAQILERLCTAHGRYQSALASLQSALAGRLHHTEDVKLAIRKKYAPSFARLCLESTSMCDLLMYGTPELGREIGRGQYGVVYSVRGAWSGRRPCAVKSVLPADERHYHELAMEFFYTRSIPAHPRIVRLLGSIVQRHGSGRSVLLVSERKCRDLHAAVRAGLALTARLRVSCDIVEGIRYLHSLGLVHRDIKMKNVLLDASDRASLSDLGFCAAEALISGSVVGTPVHMAPELQDGGYDAAVDVYAFGILFWYVCAGNVKLPSAFEVFQNKEQLWNKVKRGLRPERLPHFTDECWDIMESCWASDPSQRALLGDIQPRLEAILKAAQEQTDQQTYQERTESQEFESDDDSLDIDNGV